MIILRPYPRIIQKANPFILFPQLAKYETHTISVFYYKPQDQERMPIFYSQPSISLSQVTIWQERKTTRKHLELIRREKPVGPFERPPFKHRRRLSHPAGRVVASKYALGPNQPRVRVHIGAEQAVVHIGRFCQPKILNPPDRGPRPRRPAPL